MEEKNMIWKGAEFWKIKSVKNKILIFQGGRSSLCKEKLLVLNRVDIPLEILTELITILQKYEGKNNNG